MVGGPQIIQKETTMRSLVGIMCVLALLYLPFPLIACDAPVRVEKKPVGLKTAGPDEPNYDLTVQDRAMWKSVLHWCDECDERARGRGGIAVYPIKEGQYIVAVDCETAMQQSELIFYKVTEHADTIESRLLPLNSSILSRTRNSLITALALLFIRSSSRRVNSSGSLTH